LIRAAARTKKARFAWASRQTSVVMIWVSESSAVVRHAAMARRLGLDHADQQGDSGGSAARALIMADRTLCGFGAARPFSSRNSASSASDAAGPITGDLFLEGITATCLPTAGECAPVVFPANCVTMQRVGLSAVRYVAG